MTFMQEGRDRLLNRSPEERTARRTTHLLVAARLCFVFSHGALAIVTSAALGWEADVSWWSVFMPVWFGDTFCGSLCMLSWFASCPYIKLCLHERQARLGENPSILTDILPDIVWAILGLIFVCLALTGELLLCRYLEWGRRGEAHDLWPSVLVLMVAASLACARGILVKRSAAAALFGFAVLFTNIGVLLGSADWVLVLPTFAALLGLVRAARDRLRDTQCVLSHEEIMLRQVEQGMLLFVALVVLGLALALALREKEAAEGQRRTWKTTAATFGASSGVGVCAVAAIRARMALVESRQWSIPDRLLSLQTSEQTYPIQVPSLGCSGLPEAPSSGTPSDPEAGSHRSSAAEDGGDDQGASGASGASLPPL